MTETDDKALRQAHGCNQRAKSAFFLLFHAERDGGLERYLFVRDGGLIMADEFDELLQAEAVRNYLGKLVDAA